MNKNALLKIAVLKYCICGDHVQVTFRDGTVKEYRDVTGFVHIPGEVNAVFFFFNDGPFSRGIGVFCSRGFVEAIHTYYKQKGE